jgi:hypothetical protein
MYWGGYWTAVYHVCDLYHLLVGADGRYFPESGQYHRRLAQPPPVLQPERESRDTFHGEDHLEEVDVATAPEGERQSPM